MSGRPTTDHEQSIEEVSRPHNPRVTSGISTLDEDAPGKLESGEKYRMSKVDDEATKKRNDELNILLVIVGLLAATITSFIIYIQPQLQDNSSDDTAALLRVLLYNTNSSLFSVAPELPTWDGAPITLGIAEIILYGCLSGTLLCGLYAMLIKLLTDSSAFGWKAKIVQSFTRRAFIAIYLILSGVFLFVFVALMLLTGGG